MTQYHDQEMHPGHDLVAIFKTTVNLLRCESSACAMFHWRVWLKGNMPYGERQRVYMHCRVMLTNIALIAIQLASERPISVHAVPEGPIWLGCQREHVPGAICQIRDWLCIGEVARQVSNLQQRQVISATCASSPRSQYARWAAMHIPAVPALLSF